MINIIEIINLTIPGTIAIILILTVKKILEKTIGKKGHKYHRLP